MKSWLTKFRLSAALDADQPMPESLRQKISADPELQRFARRTEALGRALRNPPPPPDPSLHDSIMRAVRASRREQPRRAPLAAWLIPSSALSALALAGVWVAFHHRAPTGAPSLDTPAIVLEMSESMPGAMPSAVLAPLSNEWARVDRDIQNTTQILLASLP
jgi:hypothetical protein